MERYPTSLNGREGGNASGRTMPESERRELEYKHKQIRDLYKEYGIPFKEGFNLVNGFRYVGNTITIVVPASELGKYPVLSDLGD